MAMGEQIAAAIKEGLSAWKTFIATREQAYQRKRDKDQERAINAGEQYIFTNEKEKAEKDPDKKRRLQKKLSYWKKKFFHYH
jgi:hypothetical protein